MDSSRACETGLVCRGSERGEKEGGGGGGASSLLTGAACEYVSAGHMIFSQSDALNLVT